MSALKTGWQSEKTILERNRHMLENEVAADVSFEFVSSEGKREIIKAHKYMLIASSEVYEAMFGAGFIEGARNGNSAPIKVEDVDASSFRKMLRYVYCEDKSVVTFESALKLMSVAHRYMLRRLFKLCEQCLTDNLNLQNVCSLLESSLFFGAVELKKACLSFIVLDFNSVFDPNVGGFGELSHQGMETILTLDQIECDEVPLFKACIRWAESKLKADKKSAAPKESEIREKLGELLRLICFPMMASSVFADLVSESEILSSDEKLSIFYYLTSGKKDRNFSFRCDRRTRCDELRFDRPINSCFAYTEIAHLRSSHCILVTGFDFHPLINVGKSMTCRITLDAVDGKEETEITNQVLRYKDYSKHQVKGSSFGGNEVFRQVRLPKPVFLLRNVKYLVKVTGLPLVSGEFGARIIRETEIIYKKRETDSSVDSSPVNITMWTISQRTNVNGVISPSHVIGGIYYKTASVLF